MVLSLLLLSVYINNYADIPSDTPPGMLGTSKDQYHNKHPFSFFPSCQYINSIPMLVLADRLLIAYAGTEYRARWFMPEESQKFSLVAYFHSAL